MTPAFRSLEGDLLGVDLKSGKEHLIRSVIFCMHGAREQINQEMQGFRVETNLVA